MGLFLFCLELQLFVKIKEYLASTQSQKPAISITQDLNKIKKSTHPFVDICKTETCAKFQRKILNYMVVGARQSFQFFKQITWFLGNTRALSKFKYSILHHLISPYLSVFSPNTKACNFITRFKAPLQGFFFPVNFVKFLKTTVLQNTSGGCFCVCKMLEGLGLQLY